MIDLTRWLSRSGCSVIVGMAMGLSIQAVAANSEPPVLARFPTASPDAIAFVAYGNLWSVARMGGTARRLTDDPGQVLSPHFSPDGRSIAFSWRRAGGVDVYVIPASGSHPFRLTHGPTGGGYDNIVTGWTPDGKNVLFTSMRQSPTGRYEAYEVAATGGLAVPLGLGPMGLVSFSPDGHRLAFDRTFRNLGGDRWKRYVGGQAPDIYIYDLDRSSQERLTDWPGIDTAPMWSGNKIYFLSDRDAQRRANLWVTDLDTHLTHEVTHFIDYDVDMPSIGPGGISFQQGGRVYLLDLPSEALHSVSIAVPADRRVDDHEVAAARYADRSDYALSAAGDLAFLSARGDLFSVGADGVARNLTATPNAVEGHPALSPDGRTLAFVTDAAGEQQVATMPVSGGPVLLLTRFESGYLYAPRWAQDGRSVAVADANHRLWLVSLNGTSPIQVARDPADEIRDARFSPDGRWLAYSMQRPNQMRAIHLYELANGRDTIVSSTMESDRAPAFSSDGSLLFFISQRRENPFVSDRDEEATIATSKSEAIYVAPLMAGARISFGHAPVVTFASSAVVDLAGLMTRAIEVPVQVTGGVDALESRGDTLFWMATPAAKIGGDLPGETSGLHAFGLASGKESTVLAEIDGYTMPSSAAKALVRRHGGWEIVEIASGKTSKIALDKMRTVVAPRIEASEMFEQAWRLDRDLFWDSKMNGVDWRRVHDQYAALVPLVGSHEDLIYLLGEMQGELSTSHMFLGGGDRGDPRTAQSTALLGVDFSLDAVSGKYRLAHLYRGDSTRPRFAAPFGDPGLDVNDGDYLQAIDGQPIAAPIDPYSLLLGKQGAVQLTVSRTATGEPRKVVVTSIGDESEIRKLDWVEHERAAVDRLSCGAAGYLYLSDFERQGSEDFVRQFYPQADKPALVIDVRGNRGGFTSQWVLNVLRRARAGSFINREGAVSVLPGASSDRRMAVVTDIFSMSDGDQFPYFFRAWGMGKVIGERTWGGVRGIKRPWLLMDGTFITIPKDSLQDIDGHPIIENRGAEPDFEVRDDPQDIQAGRDPQLETAVRQVTAACPN